MSEPAPRLGRHAGAPGAWWRPALAIVLGGLCLSFVQPSCARGRDIRLEAARAIVDGRRTYVGDPAPSIAAARRLGADRRARIYDADLAVGSAFIYPPLAAALYAPLAHEPPARAREHLTLANHLLFAVIFLMLLALLGAGGRLRVGEVAAALGVLAVYYPLLHAVELNQATVLATALLGGTWLALQADRQAAAGCLFAAAVVLKPQLVLVLPLLAWHGRRMIAAALGAGAVLLALSLAYAGVTNHLVYAGRVLPSLTRGYGYYANHSFNGFFNRLLVAQDLGCFAQPPRSTAVDLATFAAGLAAYAGALVLVRRWRGGTGLLPWVFSFAWLTTTLISPVAWQHHYAPALFVFALLYRELRDEPAARRPRVTLPAAAAFTLMAAYFEVRHLTGVAARLAVSYLLYGALALAAALALAVEGRLRRGAPAP